MDCVFHLKRVSIQRQICINEKGCDLAAITKSPLRITCIDGDCHCDWPSYDAIVIADAAPHSHCDSIPPSMTYSVPVTKEASSEARNTTRLVTSEGSAILPSGINDVASPPFSSVP